MQRGSEKGGGAASKPSDGHRRALVVIDEEVSGDELTQSLLDHLGRQVEEVFVVAPALPESRLDLLTGEVDEAIPPARERLEGTLKQLRDAGMNARGEVGDSDPIQAMSDEIVKFEPDEVILVSHGGKDEGPAEKELIEHAEGNFEVPILQIEVNRAPEPEVLDVKSTTPGAARGEGTRTAYRGLPALNRRDTLGIVVAIVGTIILGILTAAGFDASHTRGGNHEEGRLSAEVVVMALISIAFLLINLGHIVGLLLFQSVEFEGRPNRFISRLSLIGTPVAVLVCAGLLLLAES
jgi:hypothetical protein